MVRYGVSKTRRRGRDGDGGVAEEEELTSKRPRIEQEKKASEENSASAGGETKIDYWKNEHLMPASRFECEMEYHSWLEPHIWDPNEEYEGCFDIDKHTDELRMKGAKIAQVDLKDFSKLHREVKLEKLLDSAINDYNDRNGGANYKFRNIDRLIRQFWGVARILYVTFQALDLGNSGKGKGKDSQEEEDGASSTFEALVYVSQKRSNKPSAVRFCRLKKPSASN